MTVFFIFLYGLFKKSDQFFFRNSFRLASTKFFQGSPQEGVLDFFLEYFKKSVHRYFLGIFLESYSFNIFFSWILTSAYSSHRFKTSQETFYEYLQMCIHFFLQLFLQWCLQKPSFRNFFRNSYRNPSDNINRNSFRKSNRNFVSSFCWFFLEFSEIFPFFFLRDLPRIHLKNTRDFYRNSNRELFVN